MSNSTVKEVTDSTFEPEVLNSDLPVLVDYWAETCVPCKAISAMLDDMAKDFEGRLKIAKVDVDRNPGVRTKFGVRGVPTLMLFKAGIVKATRMGGMSKGQLTSFLRANM